MEVTETIKIERYLISALVERSEVLNDLIKQVEATGAVVVKSESLGMRRLAFAIAKKTELELISVFFETDPSTIKALEAALGREEDLKRFLLTKWTVDPNAEARGGRKRKIEKEENV